MTKDKKLLINPGEVYVISKSKASFLIVVAVDSPIYPLSAASHEALENLKKAGFDIFFLFSQCNYPQAGKVNRSKFTALYEGIGFMDLVDCGPALGFVEVCDYMITTGMMYAGYSYTSLTELEALEKTDPDVLLASFISLGTSKSALPAIEILRQPREKLALGYLVAEEEEEESEYKLLGHVDYWTGAYIKDNVDIPEESKILLGEGSFNTHYSPTLLPFFPPILFHYLEIVGNGYRDSWKYSDETKEYISSAIKYYRLQYLDRSPLNININQVLKNE